MKENSIVLCIGDSISDCGRKFPVGEGNNNLGNGYVQLLHAMIDSDYPEKHIRVINMGFGGNTSRDVKARFETDALDFKPDYITLMVGINDAWRQFDMPYHKEIHVDTKEYAANVEWMIRQTLEHGIKMVLISPFFMNQNKEDAMRRQVTEYQQEMERLAKKYNIKYVNVQKEMDHYFTYNHYMVMANDGVHPNHVGHMIIAKAVYPVLMEV